MYRAILKDQEVGQRVFIAHRLRLGCGSELYQEDPKPGFAIPYDDQILWAAPKQWY